MTYFLSPALIVLRAEVNALWPGRDKASDGWIGDAAHSARLSDHNPDDNGSVNAIDVDKDGIDPERLRQAAMADRRCSYVIWSGNIWRRANSWKRETYTGINGHYHHVHISILHGDTYEGDRTGWGLSGASATAVSNTIGGASGFTSSTSIAAPAALTQEVPLKLDADDYTEINNVLLRLLKAEEIRNQTAAIVKAELVALDVGRLARDAVLAMVHEPEVQNILAAAAERAILAHPVTSGSSNVTAAVIADELAKRLAF